MKATKLLEQQHRRVESIFERLERGEDDPSALLIELANALAGHMAIEQDLFYPAVREVDDALIRESFEEHSLAEIALKRVLKTSPDDPAFDARVATLAELVLHHVEQEEDELFPAVEEALGEARLEELGTRMEQAFVAAEQQGFDALVPPTTAKTSADVALDTMRAQMEQERPAGNARPADGSAATGR